MVSSEIHLQRLLGMSLCEVWSSAQTKYLVAYFMLQQLFSKVKKISFFFLFVFFYLSDFVKAEVRRGYDLDAEVELSLFLLDLNCL